MLLDIPATIAPDQEILIDAGGAHTYEALRHAMMGVEGLLGRLGVGVGDRVGIFATNGAQYVEAFLGIAARGAVVVPMNFRARRDEAAHLLADSGSRVVFTESRYNSLIEEVRPVTLESVVLLDHPAGHGELPGDEVADVDDDDLALLLYTSGTTSLPKGVMLTHGALSGYVMETNEAADGDEHGTMLVAAPLYHIAGITSLLTSLYSGRKVVLLAQFEPADWLAAVEAHGVTQAFVVPTMLGRILAHTDFGKRDLSSLALVTYGAAPMPPSLIRRAIEEFPRSVSFSGAYGQTETTATVSVLRPDDHRLEGTGEEVETKLRRLASVGRALDDVEVRVVDLDGEPVATEQIGEVQLRTFRAMQGYWGSAERTRVTIDQEGWVHTGDLGYLDDGGYLFLSGRASDLIIRGGENIAPEEVEAVLYEHPDVIEAGAVGAPDEEWGEVVVAAVALRLGSAVSEADLLEFCAPRLAAFKRPSRIVIVPELPRTSTGKILRRELLPIVSG